MGADVLEAVKISMIVLGVVRPCGLVCVGNSVSEERFSRIQG